MMLSKRLRALADLVPPDEIVADIGSDHALLLCHLEKTGRLKKGYAMDIAGGPLAQAKKNIEVLDCNSIELLQSDGLDRLPGDVTILVIAGLGYRSIKRILDTAWEKTEKMKAVVVQCNSELYAFRSFLADKQAEIIAECWVKDYKDYQLIKFIANMAGFYNEAEIYFGPFLLKEKSPDFLGYYKRYYEKLRTNYLRNKDERLAQEMKLISRCLEDFI